MNINMQNNFIKLDYLLSDLKNNPSLKISKNLFQQVIFEIGEVIKNLQQSRPFSFTRFTVKLGHDIRQALQDLNEELSLYDADDKVQALRKHIMSLDGDIQNSPMSSSEKIIPTKIDLKIAFLCDIDVPDQNGTVALNTTNYLELGFPFITTRSLLRGNGFEFNFILSLLKPMERALLENQAAWDIFQQHNPEFGNEFLVFLPKSLYPDLSPEEKLKALDFATDGSLKKITPLEALQGPEKKADIQAFFKLFNNQPKANKLINFFGHGLNDHVGGLNKEHYLQFLDFIEYQKCKGLVIQSCYSGGASSLLNIPFSSKEHLSFAYSPLKGHSYPTLVRSIGDFVMYGGQKAEDNISLFFDQLALLLESNTLQTLSQWRKLLKKMEGRLDKSDFNQAKVYFPHSPGIPGGFRPIGETNKGHSITYAKSKQAEIFSSILKSIRTSYLQIHPLVVQAPIECSKGIIQSMIPGTAHHLMKSFKTLELEPEIFIQQMLEYYHKADSFIVSKGFFIGSLQSPLRDSSLNEVIIYIAPSGLTLAMYRKGEKYYYSNGIKRSPATPLQHALFVKEVEAATQPSEEAIRAASAGYESETLFHEALRSHAFFSESSESYEWMREIEEALKNQNKTRLLDVVHSKKMSWLDKAYLILMLEDIGFSDEAFELFKLTGMNPNIKNFTRVPLIFLAIINRNIPFIEHLIKQEVNLNVNNPRDKNNTPLHKAVEAGDADLLKLLLKSPNVDITANNSRYLSPLSVAIPKYPELFKMMLDLKQDSSESALKTCFRECVRNNFLDKVDFLLKEKSPILGTGTLDYINPLRQNKEVLIKQLLESGSFSFGKSGNNFPINVAAFLSSPKILNLLLSHKDCIIDLDTHEEGITPSLMALLSGNEEKVEALKKRGAPLMNKVCNSGKIILGLLFSRYEAWQDDDSIHRLLTWDKNGSPDLEHFVLNRYLESKPELILDLLSKGFLHPNILDTSTSPPETLFSKICLKAIRDFEKIKPLVQVCLDKGAQITNLHSIAREIRSSNALLLFKWLVEEGGDLNALNHEKMSVFNIVILTGSQDLVNYCITKGALINPSNKEAVLPLQAAAACDNDPERLIFKQLVKAGANIQAPSTPSPVCSSPLESIIKTGKIGLIDWCLEQHFDVKQGRPLHKAAKLFDNFVIFKKLVEAGADINEPSYLFNFFRYGNYELFEWCLKKGLIVKGKTEDLGPAFCNWLPSSIPSFLKAWVKQSPLEGSIFEAAYNHSGLKGLKLVFDLNEEIGPLTNDDITNLWNLIIKKSGIEAAKLLLEHKIGPFGENNEPIVQNAALKFGGTYVLKLLEEFNHPILIDKINDELWSQIVINRDVETMAFLVERGWNISKISLPKISSGRRVIKLCLDHGVSPRKNSTSFPLYDAVKSKNDTLISMLLNAGASEDVNVKDEGTHKSPLDLAIEIGDLDIINILTS